MKKLITRLLSLALICAFVPSFVLADWYLEDGSIIVEAKGDTQTVTQGDGSPTPDNNPVISNSKTPDSSKSTTNTITIKAEEKATANVTLDNVNIDVSSEGSEYNAAITTKGEGNVTIELNGTNTVKSGSEHAGLEKNNDGKLTITDSNKDQGSLDATGGEFGAGIGGGDGGAGTDITVSGGKVIAKGGKYGAGIGGGHKGDGKDITVSGGDVTAEGVFRGAGIGGGCEGDGTDITISGGDVTAKSVDLGAGIGGGYKGAGTGITVSGGEVNAQGGDSGAGIGGGARGTGTDITVSNDAQVKVQGGEKYNDYYGTGAGIGDGGTFGQDGKELSQDPGKLNGGTIRYYAPGANMQTDAPTLIVSNPKSNTAETAAEVRQEA